MYPRKLYRLADERKIISEMRGYHNIAVCHSGGLIPSKVRLLNGKQERKTLFNNKKFEKTE